MLVSPTAREAEVVTVQSVRGLGAGSIDPAATWKSRSAFLAVLVVALWARSYTVMNHDVAWLAVAAMRMLGGESYIGSFFEMNMPLAIAMQVPAILLSDVTGLKVSLAMDMWVGLLAAQSAILLLKLIPDDTLARSPHERGWASAAWILTALVVLPGYDYGQREHLMMILALPWIVLAAAAPQAVGGVLRAYLSLLAAIGFLLKPHYFALPLALLGMRALVTGNPRHLYSLESVIFVLVAIGYGLWVSKFYPDWIECASWARDLYAGFRRESWLSLLSSRPLPIVLAGLTAALACLAKPSRVWNLAYPLLVVIVYGLVSYVAQFKGWSYQLLPVTISLFLLSGVLARDACQDDASPARLRRAFSAATAFALSLLLVVSALRQLPPAANLPRTPLAQAFAIVPIGAPVLVLSTALIPAFPTVVLLDREWGSRFPSLWPLAGIEMLKRRSGRTEATSAESYSDRLRDMLREDLARYRPSLVLIDERAGQFGLPPGYSILGFLKDDPGFSRAWREYRMVGRSRDYTIHLRRSRTAAGDAAAAAADNH